jgi:hypothetical protein
MNQVLFLARYDRGSGRCLPIGRLSCANGAYEFVYVEGARARQPLVSFPDLEVRYVSPALFPVFANRVMSPNRPDFVDYLTWLGLDEASSNPLTLLARSGGRKITDSLRIIPYPAGGPGGVYEVHFVVSEDEFMLSRKSVAEYLRSEIEKAGGEPEVSVERINPPPAPSELRYLCRLRMPWPIGFEPFSGPEYQPLSKPVLQPA